MPSWRWVEEVNLMQFNIPGFSVKSGSRSPSSPTCCAATGRGPGGKSSAIARRSGRTSKRFFGAICPSITHCATPRSVKAEMSFPSCPTRSQTMLMPTTTPTVHLEAFLLLARVAMS